MEKDKNQHEPQSSDHDNDYEGGNDNQPSNDINQVNQMKDEFDDQQNPISNEQVIGSNETNVRMKETNNNMTKSKKLKSTKNNHKLNDSNSIDEEEFQDYFSNPQKRKEFDRQRLQQQMREIHNIAGFSLGQFGNKSMKSLKDSLPLYQGSEIDINREALNQKNYATVSLCCLSVTNPFRNKIIHLVAINPWFDKVILVVIVTNCIFLAMDNEIDFVTKFSNKIDLIFLIIYTIEMLLKIIAMGFFMRAHSYLRDSWNVLDFLVVIFGWLSLILQASDISSIRVIRILRPLRTINSIPGMSGLVQTILNSVPILIDIMILFGFMLIMFGTIATQLFGGKLRMRCFALDKHGHDTWLLGAEKKEVFCETDIDCKGAHMPVGVENARCLNHENPVQGTLSFDDILHSILNIFQVITLEGWTDQMYTMRDAFHSNYSDIFFIMCVLFGAFFVLNLMIAVQFTYLGEAFDEDERRQKELKERIEKRKRNRIDEELEDSFFNDDDDLDDQNTKKKSKKNCCQRNQFCVSMSDKVKKFVELPAFERFIIIIIIINTLILASESYDDEGWFPTFNEISNYVFTFIFFMEMVLKMFGLGMKEYFKEGFNIFDTVVVVLSIVDVFQSKENNSGLSVLRAFRLLRIFKIIRSWKQLRVLLTIVLSSVAAITNLGFLTILYLFIFALLAKQFFNEPLYDSENQLQRYNFQTTANALITVFIILTGENWNEIMILVMSQYPDYQVAIAIFFMSIVVIGHYMLLNLFLAILLKFISEKQDGNDDEDANENPGISYQLQPQSSQRIDNGGGGDDQNNDENNQKNEEKEDTLSLKSSNSNIEEEFEQIKLQLQELSKLSLNQTKIISHSISQKYEGGGSEGNSSSQEQKLSENNQESVNRPDELKSKQEEKATKKITFAQSEVNKSRILQYAERFIKKQKKGKRKLIEIDENSRSLYIFGAKNWLRLKLKVLLENPYFEGFIYTIIAFNSLLLALEEPVLEDQYQKKTLQVMLDIVSIIFIVEFIFKVIVHGFVIGPKTYLRDNFNKLDFLIVFFSIVNWILDSYSSGNADFQFVNSFRALRALRPLRVVSKNEGIKTVVNSLLKSIPSLMNVMLIIFLFLLVFGILGVQMFKGAVSSCNDDSDKIKNKAECVGNFTIDIKNDVGDITGTKIVQREWITPVHNYNNIFNSMLTFFEICSLEMWPDRMFEAIDAVGNDLVPKLNNNKAVSLLFIIFIFLTSFFIMNLFISVIVDKFNEEIKKRQGSHKFTEEQKEWVKIQRLLVFTNPKIIPIEPINCFRLQCFKIVQSQIFEYFIMMAILVNTIFLCIEDKGEKPEAEAQKQRQILDTANIFFVVIFTIEMILKIIAYGFKYYWHVNWNKFDFVIVVMSLIAIDERFLQSHLNFNVTALRIIRVSRLLRMVKTSKSLRQLLKTLYMSLGNILQTASLLCLILFTFTIAGMNLFADVPYNEYISKDANFKSFYLAFLTLWRACTGESWNGIMRECQESSGVIAIIYWVSFQLFTFFIFMNVFIAVIYENFNDIQASEDENDILSLKKKDIKAFQHVWAKFNPSGELKMKTKRLPEFLRNLPPPLGYQGIRIEDSKLNKIIFCLNIRDHKGEVYYPEVMWSIFHSIVGINDEQVNNCEQITNILKIVKRKYKAGLGKKVTLDSLCGNKYYRNDLTAIKYLQAMKILQRWKEYKNLQMRLKQQNVDLKQIKNQEEISNQNEMISRNQEGYSIQQSSSRQQIQSQNNHNINKSDSSLSNDENSDEQQPDERGVNTNRGVRDHQLNQMNVKKNKRHR